MTWPYIKWHDMTCHVATNHSSSPHVASQPTTLLHLIPQATGSPGNYLYNLFPAVPDLWLRWYRRRSASTCSRCLVWVWFECHCWSSWWPQCAGILGGWRCFEGLRHVGISIQGHWEILMRSIDSGWVHSSSHPKGSSLPRRCIEISLPWAIFSFVFLPMWIDSITSQTD